MTPNGFPNLVCDKGTNEGIGTPGSLASVGGQVGFIKAIGSLYQNLGRFQLIL